MPIAPLPIAQGKFGRHLATFTALMPNAFLIAFFFTSGITEIIFSGFKPFKLLTVSSNLCGSIARSKNSLFSATTLLSDVVRTPRKSTSASLSSEESLTIIFFSCKKSDKTTPFKIVCAIAPQPIIPSLKCFFINISPKTVDLN